MIYDLDMLLLYFVSKIYMQSVQQVIGDKNQLQGSKDYTPRAAKDCSKSSLTFKSEGLVEISLCLPELGCGPLAAVRKQAVCMNQHERTLIMLYLGCSIEFIGVNNLIICGDLTRY